MTLDPGVSEMSAEPATIEMHGLGRGEHILVDERGLAYLKEKFSVPRDEAEPVGPMSTQPYFLGVPVYVDSCPCEEVLLALEVPG